MPAWNSFTGKVFVIKEGKFFTIINICRIIIREKICLFSHTIHFFKVICVLVTADYLGGLTDIHFPSKRAPLPFCTSASWRSGQSCDPTLPHSRCVKQHQGGNPNYRKTNFKIKRIFLWLIGCNSILICLFVRSILPWIKIAHC